MPEIVLSGCRPEPLAHYLKALAILRLVGEQADTSARGAWKSNTFVLRTRLSEDDLQSFFLRDYVPTPIVAPWNGGSGFNPGDNTVAIDLIAGSSCSRFSIYRRTISIARDVLAELQITEKVSKEQKEILLQACRARLPDEALGWLDAAVVLAADRALFPPLLGTGGNDGRLDFTNNFMQRLLDVVSADDRPAHGAVGLLRCALFDVTVSGLNRKAAIGQFLPSGAGGANGETGFDGEGLINPWDFVLMIEGATCFAASASRRDERDREGALAFPFCVRTSAAGYGSAAATDVDNSRAELWLPLWSHFAKPTEVVALLGEGRARVGGRQAVTGVDFSRAVATLGVDRGLSGFQRIGFQVRNGLAYFATPLDRVVVGESRNARLLDEIDPWLERFFAATRDKSAPGSVVRASRRLQEAIIALCQRPDAIRSQNVLIELGECEMALAASLRWTKDRRVSPIPRLSATWLDGLDWSLPELRLACALASIYPMEAGVEIEERRRIPRRLRGHLEPLAKAGARQPRWSELESDRNVTWGGGGLLDRLNATMQRRLLLASGAYDFYPDRAQVGASLDDVVAFLDGEVDDALLGKLVAAMALIDLAQAKSRFQRTAERQIDALYRVLKMCYLSPPESMSTRGVEAGHSKREGAEWPPRVRLDPTIHRLASGGRGTAAWMAAARRLRASDFVAQVPLGVGSMERVQRVAAALLIPLRSSDSLRVAESLQLPPE